MIIKKSSLKKFIFSIVLGLFVSLITNSNVIADSISVQSTPYAIYQPDGNVMRVVFKMQFGNQNVFCLDNAKYLPGDGVTLNYTQTSPKSAAIKYIINNAPTQITTNPKKYMGFTTNKQIAADAVSTYPNPNDGSDIYRGSVNAKNTEDSTYDSYVKTQLAIWYYLNDGVIKSSEGYDLTEVVKNTYSGFDALVANAKKATPEASLTINITGNGNMSLSEDEVNYISELITISASKSVTVNLSATATGVNGIIIRNEAGQQVTSVQSGSKIRVIVPSSSVNSKELEIKLTANASSQKSSVYVYSSGQKDVQTVGRLVNIDEPASKEFKLNITKEPVVIISKTDITGKNELPGAKLQVLDKDKKAISCTIVDANNGEKQLDKCSWTSGNTSVIIKNLAPGKYYLKETQAPEGYVLSEEVKSFEVKNDGTNTEVKMENKLNVVKISKFDGTGKKELPGATLEIQDKEGNIVKFCTDKDGKKNTECKWVSTEEPYEIKGMPNGTYYLIETIAPDGYELSKEKVEFVVDGTEAIVEVEMTNELEVKVPDTLSGKSAMLLAIALIDIALGIGIVVYIKKHKINQNVE